jgi:glycosyltransferase involved in cell wall biosynthesis
LEAQVRSLGIEPHVRFLGRQARVEDFMAGFDVGALPSVAVETFSLAALEQMAIGLPMVMSNQGGAAEMLTDGEHGFIVQTGDLSALTGALARLAAPELRLRQGRAAARNVVGRFGSSAMVKRYLALCHEVGAGRASTDAAASLVR